MSLRQKEDKEKDAKKMAEILQRVGEEVVEPLMVDSVVNEEEEAQLEELARQIEEGKDISVDALPPTYHDAFLRDVAKGGITSIIPPWTPWWLLPESEHMQLASPLVTDLDAQSQSSSSSSTVIAATPCIKRFLSTKAFQDVRLPVYVSPCVSYNALEVVYLYCFFMRFYNGDEESCEDVIASIAKHSSVLSKNAVFSSADEVVASLMSDSRLQQLVEQEAKVGSLKSEKEERFCMMVFFDVLTLLETPHYLIDALAHLTILIRAVWPKDIGKERKCAFFTTYFRKMSTETFWLLRKEVRWMIIM